LGGSGLFLGVRRDVNDHDTVGPLVCWRLMLLLARCCGGCDQRRDGGHRSQPTVGSFTVKWKAPSLHVVLLL
jgi:hypothetical protein